MKRPQVNPGVVTGAAARAAERMKIRMEELRMTGRELATRLGHKDSWISALLAKKFALSLEELDAAAFALRTSPGELVREAKEGWDLAPTEQRLVRAVRQLPAVLREHLAMFADYLVGVTPPEVELLHDIRQLNAQEFERLLSFVRVVRLTQGTARGTAVHPEPPGTSSTPTETVPRARKQRRA